MNTSVQIFNFQNNKIRAFADSKGEPWFLANDVCKLLDYKNPRTAIKNHCKEWGVLKQDTPVNGVNQKMTYVNEGNLYRLVAKSTKPEAEVFEKMVFEEILPSIRKTGQYTAPQTATPEQKQHIKSLVIKRVHETGASYQTMWNVVFEAAGFNKN